MNTYGHDISIKEVLNGFVVTIGCITVVVEGKSFGDATSKLLKQLNGYLHDRDAVEQEWRKRFPTEKRSTGRPITTTTTSTTTLYPRRR